jgi:alanine-synthesizing transaminase
MARFSSRISWSLDPSRLAEAIAARRDGLLDLTESNPTAAGIEYPRESVLGALADPAALRYQPSATGLESARRAVAEQYYGGSVGADQIVLTASTSEAYSYVFKLLCDAGDRVLVPRPSYPLFEFLAHLECVDVAQYPMHYDAGWYIDTDALSALIDNRTRAIVHVSPNNPTGSYLKAAEYEALTSHGLPIVVDEVFADYAFRDDAARAGSVAGRDDVLTFALSGLSKVAGLPQMKLGWIVTSGPGSDEAMRRLELIADTFLSPGTPVQLATPQLLDAGIAVRAQIRARTAANLKTLRQLAEGSPARVLDVEGGWYATLQVPRIRSEEEWVMHLAEEHATLVQPGYFYDFESEAYLILSLLTQPDIFAEGAARTILATKG